MSSSIGALLLAAIEGSEITREEALFLKKEACSGVTLFRRNVSENLKSLVNGLQSIRGNSTPPLIIAIDQEGGRVSRLAPPFPNLGPALHLFGGERDTDTLDNIRQYGETVGSELLKLGINVNFAPVCDVLANDDNQAIGDRVFGCDVESVSLRAGAFLSGMQKANVRGCLKHFPGQGDAKSDTHLGSAVIDAPLAILERRELPPFARLLRDVDLVMISHSIYPALDHLPGTLSSKIIRGLLVDGLGYRGVVVSDDFNMGAIAQDDKTWKEGIVAAIVAGCHLLLICRHLERCQMAVDAIKKEAQRSPSFSLIVDEACKKVFEVRRKLVNKF